MKPLYIILALCLFASCKTEKWATKKIAVIEHKQPKVLATYCGNRFPPIVFDSTRVEYVPGQTIYKPGDTITVDCDSVISLSKTGQSLTKVHLSSSNIVRVPCPPSEFRVDTARIRRDVQTENKAIVEAMTLEVAEYKAKLEEAEDGRSMWRWIAIAAIALIVVAVIIRIVKR